ncbi:GyrI-like domain-containing protein [Sutcliffiella horikoshii]|uniref:GyrI-like domain-containing protein n=1 Tax=Sutcliffiella horikoshii TaxID=79883 RepID=UPI00384CF1D1
MMITKIQNKTVKEIGELKLVGYRVLSDGEYANDIPKATRQLSSRMNEIKNVIHPEFSFGAFIVDTSSEDEDGYWVGVAVDSFEDIPVGMTALKIPPQRYASAKYNGSNKDIFDAYDELHQWALQKGYKRLTDKWHIEIFTAWENPDELEVELLDTVE